LSRFRKLRRTDEPAVGFKKTPVAARPEFGFENGTSVEGIGVLAFVPRENRFPLFRIS